MSILDKVMATSVLISSAYKLGSEAHKDQKRKYTGTPYFDHCCEVANLVAAVGGSEEAVSAALLHDTVEDTTVTQEEITNSISPRVAELVMMCTDVSRPEDGNRKARKAKDLAHTAEADADGQTIKLADIISNSVNILGNDLAFSKVYIPEMLNMLAVLTKGDNRLFEIANIYVKNGERYLKLIGAIK